MAISTKGRILLIFPPCLPWFQESNEIGARIDVARHELPLMPPLGILYIAAALLNAGFEVKFVDFEGEDYSLARMQALIEGMDAVGFSFATAARPMVEQIIRDIRTARPEIPIVLGGPDITLSKELMEGADVGVIGDATDRAAEVFEKVLAHADLSDCPGLLYRSGPDGRVRQSEGAIRPENLDALPQPAFHLANPDAYVISETRNGHGRLLGVPIMTSRGCPYHCAFCCCWLLTEHYHHRSVASVLDELQAMERAGYDVVFILDDTFSANRSRAEAILDGIVARGLRLIFIMYARTDTVNETLLRKMRRAGVRLLMFGLEAGTQAPLDFYRKRTTVEQNRRVVQMAHRCGLYCLGFFMLGAPMETEQDLRETIRFAESLPLDTAIFRPLYYASPTPLWHGAREKGLIGPEDLVCLCDSSRGLGRLPAASYIRLSMDATRAFQRRPTRLLRLGLKILWWRDWTFAKRFFRAKRTGRLTRQMSYGVNTSASLPKEKVSPAALWTQLTR